MSLYIIYVSVLEKASYYLFTHIIFNSKKQGEIMQKNIYKTVIGMVAFLVTLSIFAYSTQQQNNNDLLGYYYPTWTRNSYILLKKNNKALNVMDPEMKSHPWAEYRYITWTYNSKNNHMVFVYDDLEHRNTKTGQIVEDSSPYGNAKLAVSYNRSKKCITFSGEKYYKG